MSRQSPPPNQDCHRGKWRFNRWDPPRVNKTTECLHANSVAPFSSNCHHHDSCILSGGIWDPNLSLDLPLFIGKADNPTYQQISQESNLFIGNPRLSNQKTDGQFLPGFVFSEVKWEKTLNRKLQWEPNIAPENPFPKGCHISEDNRLEGICSGARFKWTSRYPNIIPETQGVGRWHVIFGMPSFQLRCVSFRECSVELRGPKSQRIKLLDLRWKQQKKLLAKVLGMFKSKKTIKNSTLGINYYLRYMEGFDSVFWQGTFWISKHPQRLEIPWIFLRVPSTYFPPFSKKKKTENFNNVSDGTVLRMVDVFVVGGCWRIIPVSSLFTNLLVMISKSYLSPKDPSCGTRSKWLKLHG